MERAKATGGAWIESAAQLRALASPARQEIVDLLVAAGPASIADLARILGRPADGLYFHVRRLLRAGLLAEAGTRKSGRHAAALYDVAARPLRIRFGTAPTAGVRRVMKAAIRLGMRDLDAALGRRDVVTEGPDRTLWSGRFKGWIDEAERREINELLGRVVQILGAGQPGRGRRLQSLTFALVPTPPRQRGRRAAEGGTT